MKRKLIPSLLHVLVFVLIEVLFVFMILHEFPEIGFYEDMGLIHLIYWITIFLAGYIREYLHKYWTRFLATYLPVVFHIAGHIYVGEETIKHVEISSNLHTEYWIILSTIILGFFILAGEYLIHKKYHCDNHHQSVHKHCNGDEE